MAYYISPGFLDKLSVHITKNYLNIPGVKVPLILGIHGRKGEGKSFQCELVYERMGVEVVHVSAGELESPDAGDPARLLRLRYREAGELVKVRGKMAVLMINDIDAGIGRVDQYTQYTVNTQLVNATLMNIADNPTNVQLPGSYELEPNPRIPIILTGNDFSTLYAPLIRDGRMEKFFWEPDHADRIGIVSGIFEVDSITRSDVETLVKTFEDQSIDFYSALRSRLYDEQVRKLIDEVGLEKISFRVVNSNEPPPEFHKPDFSLPHLIEMGNRLVREQQRIRELRLVEEYNQAFQNRRLGDVDRPAPVQTPRENKQPAPVGSPQPESAAKGQYFTYYGDERKPEPTHRANGQSQSHRSPADNSSSARKQANPVGNASANQDASAEVSRLINQGSRLGIEYVDRRRFRTGSWQVFGTFQNQQEAIAALNQCLSEHPDDYIRLVGIDPTSRRRVTETIVQRPNGKG
ncbi:ribulose bisphosphate carboxylase small subunit [Oscillatoria sp. FACHB-1407]|uniref:ribulose bisphosphate carboxylase small subunit n=1 Tax=Oscillatoria sp. FACHB-1407 TaxID=2692847 RepID=UPI00168A1DD4|nr:ribulose bisphosphate carboxylase small subunit [Oscillatoria sp. FACHB-1407]MBD2460782.1 ribulose bisphosphate carboxylase small subunit [Oscillatoria sp. FACHB-1407]